MLVLREDIEVMEIVYEAVKLLRYVITKYDIKSYDDFTCPYMKALAKQLYCED